MQLLFSHCIKRLNAYAIKAKVLFLFADQYKSSHFYIVIKVNFVPYMTYKRIMVAYVYLAVKFSEDGCTMFDMILHLWHVVLQLRHEVSR